MKGSHLGGSHDDYWGLGEARASSTPWALPMSPAHELSQSLLSEGCDRLHG